MKLIDSIRRCVAALGLSLAAVMLFASCGGGGDGSTTPAVAPPDPSAKSTVGTAGGTVTSPDGKLVLTIPAGALGNDTEITITELAPGNQPAAVRNQHPDRVYRLEPSGLQFAQPLVVRVDLPPSGDGEYAVALVHSEGVFEAPQSLALASSATARSLTAALAHFSELMVFEEWGIHVAATVAPRSLRVGDTLDATLSISGDGTGHEATVLAEADYISTSNPVDLVFVTENLTDFHGATPPIKLPGSVVGASVASLQTWKCVRAHTGVMFFDFRLQFPLQIVDTQGNVIGTSTVTVSRLEPLGIDYVCEESAPPPGAIRTGLTPLPFGTAPDGVTLVTGPFASLPAADAPYLGFALTDGFVVMDPKTGLSVLNMTPSGADGLLGGQNLGVEVLTDSPGGPDADAALFAFNGRAYYLRRWDTTTGQWGFTEVGINTPVLDATHPPAEPDRLIFSALNRGIGFVGPSATQGFAVDPSATISQAQLGCAPSSAVQPFAGFSDVIAAVCRSLAAGGRDQVGIVDRRGGTLWNPLFELDAGTAIRIRCTTQGITTADTAVCGVTAGATLHAFKLTLGTSWTPPPRDEVPVGPGAVGVQFGLRANQLPRAVVGNIDDDSVNVVDFDAAGNRTANDRVVLPAGIDKTPHAAPFTVGGHNYVAISGNGTNNYAVLEKP